MRTRLSILMYLQYAAPGAMIPFWTLRMQEDLGFSAAQMGTICSTQALGSLVSLVVAGQVADRWWPAEKCLAVCTLASAILLWVLAGLTTPGAFFVASLGLWIFLAPAITLGTTVTMTNLPDAAQGFGPVRMWGTVGWAVSAWMLGGWFWLHPDHDYSDVFRLGSLFAFVFFGYAWTLPHTPPREAGSGRMAPLAALRLLRQRAFLIFALCTLGICITIPFASQVIPLLLQHLGIPRPWIGPTLTVGQSMEIVSLATLPMILLRLGVRGTMRLGLLAWLTAMAVMTIGEPVGLVVAALSLNGLCVCCYLVAGQVFVNSRARGDIRASAQGFFTFLTGLGLLMGNLLVGWVRAAVDEDFHATFAVATGLTLVLTVAFFVGFPADESQGLSAAEVNTDLESK